MKPMKQTVFVLTVTAMGLFLSSPVKAQGLPDGDGKDVYEAVCGACHGADIVVGSQGSRARWEETVEAMKNRGAYGSESDFMTVTNYLAKYFGLSINVNTASEKDLKDELGLNDAEVAAVVKARTAAKIADYDSFVKIVGAAKMAPLKSRLKF